MDPKNPKIAELKNRVIRLQHLLEKQAAVPGMKQVSRDEFYKFIGPQDVISEIMNSKHPYITSFHPRNSRTEVARIVPSSPRYPYVDEYFIVDDR